MKRPLINYILDCCAFLFLLSLVLTGLLLGFTLPAGSGRATVLEMTRHQWGNVHFWLAIGFLVTMILHLLLHAKWIIAMTVGKSHGRNRAIRLGGLTLVCLLAIGAIATVLLLPVKDTEPRPDHRRGEITQGVANDSPGGGRGGGGGGGFRQNR